MTAEVRKPIRPSSITLISVFMIYSALMGFYWIFRPGIQELGLATTLLFAIGGVVFLICGIGFWLMKKWAVYAYAGYAVLNQVVLLALERWNIFALLIAVIVAYVGYRNLNKMS